MFTEQNIIELAEKCLQSIIQSNGAATSKIEMIHYSKLAFEQAKTFVEYYKDNVKE